MTNDELNRKVAELRGLTCEIEEGYWPNESEVWRTASGHKVGNGSLPDYCTDPAAWGGLFQELTESGVIVLVRYIEVITPDGDERSGYAATVDLYDGDDDTQPGRALCLAYVASQETRNGQ